MKLKDRLNRIFRKEKNLEEMVESLTDEDLNEIFNNNKENTEKYEVLVNDIDTFILYVEGRVAPYILIKDSNFPFMMNNSDLEWINDNKDNFKYYGEFRDLGFVLEKLEKLRDKEILEGKTENDYLKDYLEHCTENYKKIISKMEELQIDKAQYDEFLNKIKVDIKNQMQYLLENYINSNKTLNTNRSYDEITDTLVEEQEFKNKYPFYNKIMRQVGQISHCGYPDYMWQSGAERRLYNN